MANKHNTLGEQAYLTLRKKVSTMGNGSYLSMRQFANEIGISYTPVREAFLRLNREGMLKQIPNVGYFVASMDISDMLQVFQVRECIEPFVLQKVFPLIEPKHTKKMREYLNQQLKNLEAEDILQYMKVDIKLHGILIDLINNQYLKSTYYMVRDMYMFCSNNIAKNLSHVAYDEHLQLIEAIEAKDEKLSLNLVNIHLENAKHRLMNGYTNVNK